MKKLLVLALAASMTLGLAACGSSSSDKAADTAPAETTESADAAESTGSDKTWIIAMDTVFRPFEYTDENGEFVGIDVDIIKAVGRSSYRSSGRPGRRAAGRRKHHRSA